MKSVYNHKNMLYSAINQLTSKNSGAGHTLFNQSACDLSRTKPVCYSSHSYDSLKSCEIDYNLTVSTISW